MHATLATYLAEHSLSGTVEELRLGDVSFYDLAEHFHERRDFVLLDSQTHEDGLGACSLLSFEPFVRYVSKDGRNAVHLAEGVRACPGDALDALQRLFDAYSIESSADGCDVPFRGGAIGYFGYELGRQIEVLPRDAVDDLHLPDCYLGFYNFAIVLDHAAGRMFMCHLRSPDDRLGWSRADLDRELRAVRPGSFQRAVHDGPLVASHDGERTHVADQSVLSQPAYQQAVGRIKEYIRAGDVYQVNMTQRFCADLDGATAWNLFKQARDINAAPFAAYLHLDGHTIVSCSPERFFSVRDRRIETRPIKGTIARGRTAQEDIQNRQTLMASAKNRAELAMIVDLLRNDIGRVCVPGSVRVRAFPALESYASVHHLVATITGDVEPGRTVTDLIRAMFPGGSITGAPKIRAMEIIDELEPVTRGIYTGSIGYIGFDGALDLNIAIRTIVVKDGRAYFSAGGGVVADSVEQDEYEESLLKARKLVEAIDAVRRASSLRPAS
jgi:para-aminobenzoate synthetase component I